MCPERRLRGAGLSVAEGGIVPEGRLRVSEGRYRTTELDCKMTELAVEIPDDSHAPLRTMELGAYPFLDDIVLWKNGGGEASRRDAPGRRRR